MSIEIMFFGQLTDKTGCALVVIDNPGTISQLKKIVIDTYPNLVNAKFTIALNNKMVLDETVINENAKIAIMPPFSGG